MCVNEMHFNLINTDVFVAGYGDFNQEYGTGMIALWTLKNPRHPECFIRTDTAVLTTKFSAQDPNLFACGFSNGNLHIYDTR